MVFRLALSFRFTWRRRINERTTWARMTGSRSFAFRTLMSLSRSCCGWMVDASSSSPSSGCRRVLCGTVTKRRWHWSMFEVKRQTAKMIYKEAFVLFLNSRFVGWHCIYKRQCMSRWTDPKAMLCVYLWRMLLLPKVGSDPTSVYQALPRRYYPTMLIDSPIHTL